MKAWHFVGETLRDGLPIPKDGEKLVHHGEIKLCVSGLHASIHPFDALKYAPGTTLCLVECAGEVDKEDDKLVCTERTIIARMDFSEPLRYFARMQALSVIHLWELDPPEVVLDWLMTGDEGLRTDAARAADAAGYVANAVALAAYAAAGYAAYAAADAANAAAFAAALAADAVANSADAARGADAAARAVAYAARAAGYAAADAVRAAGYAAADAVGTAARAAANAAARDEFEALVNECFEGVLMDTKNVLRK